MDLNPRAPIPLAVGVFLALAASVAAGAEDNASGISLGRRAGGFLHGLKDSVVDGDHGVALDEVGPGLFDALFASLSLILVSEIGDETFIIAALMAMRHPKSIVLSGALSALYVMTNRNSNSACEAANLSRGEQMVQKCSAWVENTPEVSWSVRTEQRIVDGICSGWCACDGGITILS